jgi:hypothetical protein
MIVTHEYYKGHAIRRNHYSLEALSLSQVRPNGVLTPRVEKTYKTSRRRVAPLEHKGAY